MKESEIAVNRDTEEEEGERKLRVCMCMLCVFGIPSTNSSYEYRYNRPSRPAGGRR